MTRPRTVWEVDVPIKHRNQPLEGVHVFTGVAKDANEALAAARHAFDIATLHQSAGKDIPRGTSLVDWTARGLRPDWVLDWNRATRPKDITL